MDFIKQHQALTIPLISSIPGIAVWYPFYTHQLYTKASVLLDKKEKLSLKSLYKGIIPTVSFQLLFPFAFASQQFIISILKKNNLYSKPADYATSMTIGLGSAIIANPLVVFILKQQQGLAPLQIIKTTPIKNYYRGLVPFAMKGGCFFIAISTLYPHLNESFGVCGANGIQIKMLSAIIASVLCNFAIIPLDLSSIMRQSANYGAYSSARCVREVWARRGIQGIFAGYRFKVVAVAIEIFIFNCLKDYFTQKFQ